jgi:hypothetical protein
MTEKPLLISRRASAPSSTAASTRPASSAWPISTESPIISMTDIVPFDVETDMFEAQDRVHPGGAAHALDAEALAAQLLGGLETRIGEHRMVSLLDIDERIFRYGPEPRRRARSAAGVTDLKIAGDQTGDQDRRAFDQDNPRFDILLGEQSCSCASSKGIVRGLIAATPMVILVWAEAVETLMST